jgi:hypothetical protein
MVARYVNIYSGYHVSHFSGQDQDELDLSAFFPRLQRLNLPRDLALCRQIIPSNTLIPQLQYFSVELRQEDLADILRNAPLLIELYWSRITNQDDPYPTPLTLRNLRSLTFSNNCIVPLIRGLELFNLPRLTRLGIGAEFLDPAVIHPFLSRSACVIREFECEITGTPTAATWSQLGMFSYVETLDMTVSDPAEPLEVIDTKPNPHGRLISRPVEPPTCNNHFRGQL